VRTLFKCEIPTEAEIGDRLTRYCRHFAGRRAKSGTCVTIARRSPSRGPVADMKPFGISPYSGGGLLGHAWLADNTIRAVSQTPLLPSPAVPPEAPSGRRRRSKTHIQCRPQWVRGLWYRTPFSQIFFFTQFYRNHARNPGRARKPWSQWPTRGHSCVVQCFRYARYDISISGLVVLSKRKLRHS